MSEIVVDGRTRVTLVSTISSSNLQPTVAELAAGLQIQSRLVPTGLEGFEASQADVDNTSLASDFDTKLGGRKSYSGTGLMLKDDDAATDAVLTLLAEGTNLYVHIRDKLLESAANAAGQVGEVYPVRTGLHQTMGRGEANSLLRKRVSLFISAKPNTKAVTLA